MLSGGVPTGSEPGAFSYTIPSLIISTYMYLHLYSTIAISKPSGGASLLDGEIINPGELAYTRRARRSHLTSNMGGSSRKPKPVGAQTEDGTSTPTTGVYAYDRGKVRDGGKPSAGINILNIHDWGRCKCPCIEA